MRATNSTNSTDADLIVIAHFSRIKTMLIAAFLLLLTGLAWWSLFRHPANMSRDAWLASKNTTFYGGLFVMVMCTIALAVNQFDVLKRLQFHNAIAIWRDGEKIVFLNENFNPEWQETAVASIASISKGSWYFWPAIVLTMKDGSKTTLANRTYSESTDTIIARFQSVVLG